MREVLVKCRTGYSLQLGNTVHRLGGGVVMLCSIARRYRTLGGNMLFGPTMLGKFGRCETLPA